MRMTAESESLARILAYLAENKRRSILKKERLQDLAYEAEGLESGRQDQTIALESWRLDCMYDNEPLGFEKYPLNESQKMQAQDPFEEIDLVEVYIDDIVIKSSSRGEHLDHLRCSFDRMRKHGFKMNLLKCAFGMHAGDFLGFVVHKRGIKINENKTKAILNLKSPSTKKQLQSLLGKINFLRRFISNLSGKTKVFLPLLKIKREIDLYWGLEQQEDFDAIKGYHTKPHILLPPSRKKNMSLYVVASDTTIGSMLAQGDISGVERPIYYLSRVLADAETRIGKRALALTEFSLTFKPLKAIKGQPVVDFIVDHAMVESSLTVVDTKPWHLYFDGSSHKDGTGVGVLILSPQDGPTKIKYKISEKCSNNEAEYGDLIIGLRILKGLGASRIEVRGDSELVVKHVTREYKCIKESLLKHFVTATQLLKHFEVTDIRHVPRNENQEANELDQIDSGYKIYKSKFQDMIEVREKMVSNTPPLTEDILDRNNNRNEGLDKECQEAYGLKKSWEHGVFTVNKSSPTDWRKPIVEYLENLVGGTNRKTKYRALRYVLSENELLKKTPEAVLLKCLGDTEAYLAIYELSRLDSRRSIDRRLPADEDDPPSCVQTCRAFIHMPQ
ncbi:uncharacterized protein LOC127079231 [Lathyrus oleraceus]|uniref:uncharacterized protein LOC127079231 n=1 Tax=Pisum sativum TaxID=3888 RepID=UPI0021D3475F|nr:uncharacterized protein LOC127079231 [Pisum sativum]